MIQALSALALTSWSPPWPTNSRLGQLQCLGQVKYYLKGYQAVSLIFGVHFKESEFHINIEEKNASSWHPLCKYWSSACPVHQVFSFLTRAGINLKSSASFTWNLRPSANFCLFLHKWHLLLIAPQLQIFRFHPGRCQGIILIPRLSLRTDLF